MTEEKILELVSIWRRAGRRLLGQTSSDSDGVLRLRPFALDSEDLALGRRLRPIGSRLKPLKSDNNFAQSTNNLRWFQGRKTSWFVMDLETVCQIKEIRVQVRPVLQTGASSVSLGVLKHGRSRLSKSAALVRTKPNENTWLFRPQEADAGAGAGAGAGVWIEDHLIWLKLVNLNRKQVAKVEILGFRQLDGNLPADLVRWKASHGETLDLSSARILLEKVYSELEDMGLSPFLCFGTLLGAVRDGTFITHDKDVDLALLTEPGSQNKNCKAPQLNTEALAKLVVSLERFGIKLIRDLPHLKSFWFKSDYLDIYLFQKTPGGETWRCGNYALIPGEVGSFSEVMLEARRYRAPENPELYLQNRYGADWRVPIRDFHATT